MVQNIFYLVLGGILTIAGTVFINLLQRRIRKRDFIKGVKTELRELKHTMAMIVFKMRHRLGQLEDDLYTFILPIIEEYQGPEKDQKEIEASRKLSTLSYEQRLSLRDAGEIPGKTPRPIMYQLTFIENNLSAVSFLSMDVQRLILQIRQHLDYFNQQVKFVAAQFDLTFYPDTDHEAINTNLEDGYNTLSKRANFIVEKINEFEEISR